MHTDPRGGIRLFGLIGYPLSHSFSKRYFTGKFEQEGLTDCRFENFSIASIDELPAILKANPQLEGLAVTIPYKQQVLQYIDDTNIPSGLRACNCIKISGKELLGYNTDHSGFQKSIESLLQPHHRKALILGNGGATAAVAFAFDQLGIETAIVSRQLHDGSTMTYAEMNEEVMREFTIIVNTTPLGMFPAIGDCPPIPYELLTSTHLLYDLVYNPEKTIFLQKGEKRGAVIKNGEEMLVIQAEENWKIWNQ